MRKNSKFYLGILLVSGMLGLSSPARSQLVGGVSFDFGGDAAAAITPVFEQIQTAADEAVKYAKEKVTKLKASIGSYFTKRKNAAEKVPGTKQFAEETSVDIYDPAAVQTAINELFLQYPSSDQRVNRFYEKEAAEFYYDTMIEIQTASKKLEAQLNSLRTEIDNFSKDAIAPSGGNAGSMSSSDENGNYYNLYLAHKKFNDVLKVTEEVMALYSQYYVARAIYRKTILPAPYQEESAEGEGKKIRGLALFQQQNGFCPVCQRQYGIGGGRGGRSRRYGNKVEFLYRSQFCRAGSARSQVFNGRQRKGTGRSRGYFRCAEIVERGAQGA